MTRLTPEERQARKVELRRILSEISIPTHGRVQCACTTVHFGERAEAYKGLQRLTQPIASPQMFRDYKGSETHYLEFGGEMIVVGCRCNRDVAAAETILSLGVVAVDLARRLQTMPVAS